MASKWLDTAQAGALIGEEREKKKKKNPKPFNRAVVDMPKIIQLTQDQR
jgi:hypothetical protein